MSYLELARKALEKCPRINPTDVPMANPQCDESDQSDKSPLACPAAQGQEGEPRGTLAEADADEVEGRYWYPPPEIPLCFQDESGRPCSPGEAYLWTWQGARTWFRANRYPVPYAQSAS